MWDIKGKVANLPVYKLLGGFTNKVDTYIAGGYYEKGKGLKELAKEMEDNVHMGAKSVKIKVGALSINEDIERVKVCREVIGNDIKLMVDANNAYRHYQAIEFARKAEKYDLVQEMPKAPGSYAQKLFPKQIEWENGYSWCPDTPGLGVDIDMDIAESMRELGL